MATIAERLRDAPEGHDDYVGYLYDLLDGPRDADADDTTFVEAFRFIERNADADLGTPGPLIQFLERFYPRYCARLVESVQRRPTLYTLWMLNRILNSSPIVPSSCYSSHAWLPVRTSNLTSDERRETSGSFTRRKPRAHPEALRLSPLT